jgi:hypothetical protein
MNDVIVPKFVVERLGHDAIRTQRALFGNSGPLRELFRGE